jgi:signal transduction histidine kinase
VSVQRKYDNKLLEVAGDHDMLEHVFLNLVNNAVAAMKERKEKILTVRAYKQLATEVGYKTGYRRADFFNIGDEMIIVEISDTGKESRKRHCRKYSSHFLRPNQLMRELVWASALPI